MAGKSSSASDMQRRGTLSTAVLVNLLPHVYLM